MAFAWSFAVSPATTRDRFAAENLPASHERRDNFFMRGERALIAWWVAVALTGMTGCFDTPQEVLDDISCQKVCDCLALPDCQAQCLAVLAPVSQECFDFATTNAQDCTAIEDSIQTGGVCRPEPPVP